MPLRTIASTSLLVALLATAAPAAAQAPAKTIDIPALQKLIAGLGLEDTGDKTSIVTVTGQGGNGYNVSFQPSNDNSYVVIFTAWQSIPKEKMSMLPAVRMLEYNDTHTDDFSLSTDKDGLKFIALQGRLPAAAVTPQSMRQYIDLLVSAADETAELWDTDKWKRANGAKPN